MTIVSSGSDRSPSSPDPLEARKKIDALYTRPDVRPLTYDARPRPPTPSHLLRQIDAHDLEAMVEAALREQGAAPPSYRDVPGPVIHDAPVPVVHDAPDVANDVTPMPVEVDVELDSALIDYLHDAPTPSNDTRYSYVNEGAIPIPRRPRGEQGEGARGAWWGRPHRR